MVFTWPHAGYTSRQQLVEIEDFVKTHLCKLCLILRSLALRVLHAVFDTSIARTTFFFTWPHAGYASRIRGRKSLELQNSTRAFGEAVPIGVRDTMQRVARTRNIWEEKTDQH